jgi:hypothetical protein
MTRSPLDIPERDWKHLRTVKAAALERFCERVLQECAGVLAETDLTAHERYLKLFKLIDRRDDELAGAFDDLRRSTAIFRLMTMRSLGVVTDEEMEGFTPETRSTVDWRRDAS